MGGERGRQGGNVSLHVAGPVSSRFAYILDPDGVSGLHLMRTGEHLSAGSLVAV